MDSGTNLTNHFLIAMPGRKDSNFFHTVTYICEHNEDGAMGIVLNRPTDLQLEDILEQLDIERPGPEKCACQPGYGAFRYSRKVSSPAMLLASQIEPEVMRPGIWPSGTLTRLMLSVSSAGSRLGVRSAAR